MPEVIEQAKGVRADFTGVVFVFVGRLVGDKGVNELVAAFKILNEQHTDTRLYLVGPQEDNLDPLKPETIAEIDTNACIVAVGRQSDVRPWLAAADVFVLPSYREVFPNVVLEAESMSLPCIVSEVNGATDAIANGENGFVIPKRDVDALRGDVRVV